MQGVRGALAGVGMESDPELAAAQFAVGDGGIKERGLAIPGDIAVIGFDNREVIAAYLRPELTTVALPFEKMGALVLQTLAALTAGQPITAGQQLVDCPLLERSSV